MRWTDCRVVAFDTETTGLNPFDGDRIVEFGAVEVSLDAEFVVQEVRPTHFLVNPEMPIPRESTRVTGIADTDVAGEPPFRDRAGEVQDLLRDAIVVAQNLPFDIGFLRSELGRAGLYWPRTLAEVDTLPLAQRLLPHLPNHKLETIARELHVPLDGAHRAHQDAEATGRCLAAMARRHQAPGDLEEMARWADAVSVPPETGQIAVGERGVPEFLVGPFAGEPVERHADHLQWMLMARERRDGRWHDAFPDSLREWARRWLRVRASGRAPGSPRGQGRTDWCLDPPTWT